MFGGLRALVNRQIVEDDDIALRQCRGELGLDVGVEANPVHGLVEDPWRGQSKAAQSGDEGLGLPMAKRGFHAKPVTAQGTPAQPHHFRVERGFIKKHKPVRLKAHPWLTLADPDLPLLPHLGACAFRRPQRFFYM